MLNSIESLGWKATSEDQKNDRLWGLASLVGYAVLSLIWAFSVDAPWDDDCPTRFFNTQNAFAEPLNFVSVWNRPLFVLIFALPSQLGKEVIPLLMTLISTLGAWLLGRGMRELKVPNAWLAIPFMAFQPFFFGTSRVALTEPLAAVLICAGFYFLVRKKWMGYALMGGLLPLARLEMSVVLVLWLIPMVQARQWKHMAWMMLPFVLWNVAAGFIVGDFNYVFNQTFGADSGENRYGNTSFSHYFERSMWVTGPVVFWFLLQGLAFRIAKKGLSIWVDGQLVLGLLVYVVFSWKMSMGNAAGFLRNLVPLTPLAAIVALDGYNYSLATLLNFHPPKAKRSLDLMILAIIGATTVLLTGLFFSVELHLHQILGTEQDFSRLGIVLLLAAGAIILFVQNRTEKPIHPQLPLKLTGFVAILTMGYALYQEPPSASENYERQGLGIVAEFYANSKFVDRPTYANHNWFFWVAGERPQDPRFKRVTIKNLEAAPVGAIAVWDVHYSTRLAGDVDPQYLANHLEWVELLRIGVANRGESVILLEKAPMDSTQQEVVSRKFADENPKYLPAITARSFRLLSERRFPEALNLFQFALQSVKNDPDLWFGHGYALLHLGRLEEAANSLNNAAGIAENFPIAWYNLGQAYSQMGDFESAVTAFNRALIFDPNSLETWFSRGMAKVALHDMEGGIGDFTQVLQLYPQHLGGLINRAAAYAMTERFDLAARDIAQAETLKPGNLETVFVKGRILFESGDKEAGCKLMREAVAAGFAKAAQVLAKTCDLPQDSLQALPQ